MATTIEAGVGKKSRRAGTLFSLFFIFLKIGAFTWGGGYCMLPLIQCEVVEKKEWLSREEFIGGIALSTSVPGAIAVNIASFVGSQVAGTIGSLVATLGAVIPSYVAIVAASIFLSRLRDIRFVQDFFRGVTPAIVALLASALVDFGKDVLKSYLDIIVTAGLIGLIILLHVHPVLLILVAAVVGLLRSARK